MRGARVVVVASMVLAFACGGSQSGPGTTTESPAGDCSFGGEDPCVTSDALAQCQAMAAQCPGRVQRLETCPLQFACPGEAAPVGDAGAESPGASADASASVANEPESCEGHRRGDACMNDANFAQCQQMAAQCPGQVRDLETCPLQFACP